MVLTSEAVLTWIGKRIKLVSPMALEIEPSNGCVGSLGRGSQLVVLIIISVAMNVESGIPEWAAVGDVVQ